MLAVLAVLATLSVTLIFLPWEPRHEQMVRDTSVLKINAARDTATYTPSTISISAVDASMLAAWRYLPKGINRCAIRLRPPSMMAL